MLACFYIQGEQVMRKRNDGFEDDKVEDDRGCGICPHALSMMRLKV